MKPLLIWWLGVVTLIVVTLGPYLIDLHRFAASLGR